MVERKKWSVLTVAMVLSLAACAHSQFVSDLHSAEAPCRDQHFKDKAGLDDCLSAHERPVWAREDPATLDLYDGFARARAALARQYDSGAITERQYSDQLEQLESATAKAIDQRRKQVAAKP
ncbi:MAG TPA: hypothetical protein VMA53_24000 [Stellaceae bacterium]|nr:hypothetical protein [Stellaceae bacterium]